MNNPAPLLADLHKQLDMINAKIERGQSMLQGLDRRKQDQMFVLLSRFDDLRQQAAKLEADILGIEVLSDQNYDKFFSAIEFLGSAVSAAIAGQA